MSDTPGLTIAHLGWSGFRIVFAGGAELYVDPPKGAALPLEQETGILLTHGHPEHIGGTMAHLGNPHRHGRVRVAASKAVCRYLRGESVHPGDQFETCRPHQHMHFSGLDIDVFRWRHMPLLPPGFKQAVGHIRRLVSRPTLAWRIIAAGLRGPRPFPMLGFRITSSGGESILVYGEGLHRLTSLPEARRVGAELPAEILLVAVEPEDVDVLPELVSTIGSTIVGLYEAHRGWREAFGMPCADLHALASTLAARQKRALVFRPGTSIAVAD